MPDLIGVPAMFSRIKRSFNGGEETEDEIIEEYIGRGILFLDDIGAENPSEYVRQTSYLIINGRYEREKQTVFTSNLSPTDLADRIGTRIVSRICETCKIIEITGKDRRLEQTKR